MSARPNSTPGYHAPSPSDKPDAGAERQFTTEIHVNDARELDERATSEYGVPPTLLMEHAAIGLRDAAIEMIGGDNTCWIVSGPGNNGGDGVALARLLHNDGVGVRLFHIDPARDYSSEHVRGYVRAVRALGIAIEPLGALNPNEAPSLVVDAVLGTGIHGPPRGTGAEAVAKINACREHGAKVLACDVPSGLDAQSGEVHDAAVFADRTVTFVAPKPGLTTMHAQPHIGELVVASIGAPRPLVERYVRRVEPQPRGDS